MATKSSKNAKNASSKGKKATPQKNEAVQNDILGIIIIALGILTTTFIFEITGGILGRTFNLIAFSSFGSGAYCFPFLLILLGVCKLANAHAPVEKRKNYLIAFILWFVSIVSFLDIYWTPFLSDTFLDKVSRAISLGQSHVGGGLVGAVFSYWLMKLVGKVGAYILITLTMIVATILFFDRPIKDFFAHIKMKWPAKKEKSLSKKQKQPIIAVHDQAPTEKELPAEKVALIEEKPNVEKPNIKIMDYMAKSKGGQETTETDGDIQKEIVQNQIQYTNYQLPSVQLLAKPSKTSDVDNNEKLEEAKKLEHVLSSFDVDAKVLQISIGPTITRYELSIPTGIKVNKITNLAQNIALELASTEIRIEAPIPGKAAIGIEVPNKKRSAVHVREVIDSSHFKKEESKIPFAIGKNISGEPVVESIEKMPHMLIAGATGSGKSVCINTLITSVLYKATPEEVKFILIDPKVVELNIYNGIPHLLIPVVTDPRKASSALNWAVAEMTNRYKLFAEKNVRDFKGYNKKCIETGEAKMPIIIIIIDELADLMMVAPGEVEDAICRLAQMARAAGIHLVVATQRPSVDVITGTIKANIPSRIAFSVSSQIDSRTILGMGGAEKLLGRGDMLYFPVGESKPVRLQGAFISDEEVSKIVEYLKSQKADDGGVDYNQSIIDQIETSATPESIQNFGDELIKDAIQLVVNDEQASISYIQRRLKVGYARAARIIDEMEAMGVVGPSEGSKPRKVLIGIDELEKMEL